MSCPIKDCPVRGGRELRRQRHMSWGDRVGLGVCIALMIVCQTLMVIVAL